MTTHQKINQTTYNKTTENNISQNQINSTNNGYIDTKTTCNNIA